jgi:hypothetical protein
MLPHYLSSDDKIPLYAGKSLESIVLAIFPVTINRFGQSAGNLRSLTSLVESSETKHGLSEQWLNWLTGLIEADGFFPNEPPYGQSGCGIRMQPQGSAVGDLQLQRCCSRGRER